MQRQAGRRHHLTIFRLKTAIAVLGLSLGLGKAGAAEWVALGAVGYGIWCHRKRGGSGIQGGAWAGAIAFPLATLANALMLYLEGSRPSQIVMGAWLMLSMIAPFLGAMPGAFLGLIFAFCADIIAAQRRLNARRRSGRVLRPLQPIEPEMSVETHAHADGSGPTNV